MVELIVQGNIPAGLDRAEACCGDFEGPRRQHLFIQTVRLIKQRQCCPDLLMSSPCPKPRFHDSRVEFAPFKTTLMDETIRGTLGHTCVVTSPSWSEAVLLKACIIRAKSTVPPSDDQDSSHHKIRANNNNNNNNL